MEDNEIIEMMFERDESALRLIKEKYGTKLKRIAFGILQNESDAEECENDTYMRVWQSIPPANPGNHLLAYLSKTIRNLAINRYVKDKNRNAKAEFVSLNDELEEMLPAEKSTEDIVIGEIERELFVKKLNVFLDSLSREQRNVFLSRYIYLESIDIISQKTGFSKGKIKTMLWRMRKKFKAEMAI